MNITQKYEVEKKKIQDPELITDQGLKRIIY